MESLSRGGFGLLLATVFAIFIAQPAEAGRPDFENSKPGNVNCNGKALGHDKNSPRGKAHGRGDDCDVVENTAPVADAGSDIDALGNDTVTLDGSASSDADGDTLSFSWQQVSGANVTLSNATSATPEFTAPVLTSGDTLVFELTVSDVHGASDSARVSVVVPEGIAPTATITPEGALGFHTEVVVTFSEPVDPASLQLEGSLAALSPRLEWSTANDELTLRPEPYWESGDHDISVSVSDPVGNRMSAIEAGFDIRLVFSTFQAASVVIGQPDFQSNQRNQGGIGPNTLGYNYGNAAYDRDSDILFVPDLYNDRVLGFHGIPTENNANADFALGQVDLFGNASTDPLSAIDMPRGMHVADGKLLLSEHHSRISIYDPVPATGPGTIDTVIGQVDKTSRDSGCDAQSLTFPLGRWLTPDGKLLVTDRDNNRVLIWNSLPTTDGEPADLVLGQQDFVHCERNDSNGDGVSDAVAANTLSTPRGVWSDGERVVVTDDRNRRILIWNSFPTTNGAPADIVLGQDTMDASNVLPVNASSLHGFTLTFWSNGEQLIVSDILANRVLVWNRFPTSNNEPADVVLGQSDFFHSAHNDEDQDGFPDATAGPRTFYRPSSVSVAGDKLFVSDFFNSRVLVFESQ